MPARFLDDTGHRDYRPQGIGDVDYRYNTGPFIQEFFICLHDQFALVINRDHLEHRAGLFAQDLPGDDIGMMLHGGDDDFIPGLQGTPPERLGNQIDRLGSTTDKYDFLVGAGVEKVPDLLPSRFVCGRGLRAERMHTAMDIRIVVAVIVIDGFDNLDGLLRRGGVIQIDQRLAMDPAGQDREIRADGLDIECGRVCLITRGGTFAGHFMKFLINSVSGNLPTTDNSRRSRTGLKSIRLITSSAKAKVSRLLAVFSSMARDRK